MNKVILVGKVRKTTAENGAVRWVVFVRVTPERTDEIPVFIPPDLSAPEPDAYLWIEGSAFINKRGFLGIRVSSWRTLDGKVRSKWTEGPAGSKEVPF